MLLLFSALLSVFSPLTAAEKPAGSMETKVKAAYILNIMKFVSWTATEADTADSPILLGLLGNGAIGETLLALPAQKIADRDLKIEQISSDESHLRGFHLLFIDKSEEKKLAETLKLLEGSSVLTASDIPSFARKGGAIGFIIENGKVRIEINVEQARKTGLKIPAKLMEVARLIK